MKTVYKTAFIVTIFSLAEKFLGFLYRIYLSRTIGSEGIGLYQISLSVFALLLTFSCSGIPVTVSRLITKYRTQNETSRINKVATAGFLVTIIVALPITLIILLFPSAFNFLFADERCLPIFLMILPALTVNAVYSVLRGIFWGNKDFLPYSVIELIEETVMIIFGVLLVSKATTVVDGAQKAVLAVLISYVSSFCLGTALFLYRGGKVSAFKKELKPLIASSIPITAMRTANSFAGSMISLILPAKLIASGLSKGQATSAFGAFYGMALPLLSSPMSLIGPFTIVLIPQIAESFYKKDLISLKNDIDKALNITVFLSALMVPAFLVFGEDFGILLFKSYEGGIYTSHSAYLMILIGLSAITTSILNSIGMEKQTFISFLISTAFMLLSIVFLPRYVGIYALLIGYTCVYGINTVINLIFIKVKTGVKLKTGSFAFYSILFLIPSAFLGFLLKRLLINFLGPFLTAIGVSALILTFNFLLYIATGLIDTKFLINRIKRKKPCNGVEFLDKNT